MVEWLLLHYLRIITFDGRIYCITYVDFISYMKIKYKLNQCSRVFNNIVNYARVFRVIISYLHDTTIYVRG